MCPTPSPDAQVEYLFVIRRAEATIVEVGTRRSFVFRPGRDSDYVVSTFRSAGLVAAAPHLATVLVAAAPHMATVRCFLLLWRDCVIKCVSYCGAWRESLGSERLSAL